MRYDGVVSMTSLTDDQLATIEASANRAIAADDDHDDVRAKRRGEFHDDTHPEAVLALIAEVRAARRERQATVAMLRIECGEIGDNDWLDTLHLADPASATIGDLRECLRLAMSYWLAWHDDRHQEAPDFDDRRPEVVKDWKRCKAALGEGE